jgi:formate dehydrogenase subunit gamma
VKRESAGEAPHSGGSHQSAIDEAIGQYAALPGALLPVLHAIQDRLGFIPPEALPRIAKALNLSRAEVHGVITFYHDFRTSPRARHVVKVCRAEACQSMGGEALAAHIKTRLGADFHHASSDGAVTLEPVFCLGNCACSPALTIDGRLYGRVTPERFDQILQAAREIP